MPAERLSMRKVREVLRLRHALSLSYREISEALGVGKTAAGEIVRRAEVVGLTWPLPQLFDDGELERRLFTAPGASSRSMSSTSRSASVSPISMTGSCASSERAGAGCWR